MVGRIGPLANVFDFVANAAPGVKEILTVGKVCWEVRESIEGRADWDLVVVDAAATGHVLAQLDAPRTIRELVHTGPIRNQTEWMIEILSDPALTALNVVTAPEEMPVNETIELVARGARRDHGAARRGDREPGAARAVHHRGRAGVRRARGRRTRGRVAARRRRPGRRRRARRARASRSRCVALARRAPHHAARVRSTCRCSTCRTCSCATTACGSPAWWPTRSARSWGCEPEAAGGTSGRRAWSRCSRRARSSCSAARAASARRRPRPRPALAAAVHVGGRVLVLTIDPARRLADALGLEGIGNVERRVPDDVLRACGLHPRGELWAAMLDTKASWDDLVLRHAPDEETAYRILDNRLYANLTSRFVQSHDYIAMERLYDLHSTGKYDLIVVDTPPSRNALDFLDAPQRMADFFGGRLLRWLTMPYRLGGRRGARLVNLASKPFYQVADRILGTQFLQDIAEFFLNFETMYAGFVTRAARRRAAHARPAHRRSWWSPRSRARRCARPSSSAPSSPPGDFHLGAMVLNRVLPGVAARSRGGDRGRARCDRATPTRSRPRSPALGDPALADPVRAARVLRTVGASRSRTSRSSRPARPRCGPSSPASPTSSPRSRRSPTTCTTSPVCGASRATAGCGAAESRRTDGSYDRGVSVPMLELARLNTGLERRRARAPAPPRGVVAGAGRPLVLRSAAARAGGGRVGAPVRGARAGAADHRSRRRIPRTSSAASSTRSSGRSSPGPGTSREITSGIAPRPRLDGAGAPPVRPGAVPRPRPVAVVSREAATTSRPPPGRARASVPRRVRPPRADDRRRHASRSSAASSSSRRRRVSATASSCSTAIGACAS